MQQSVRIGRLDDFKWIAAFLVVAIHTSPLESVSGNADFVLTRILARVAVPFFFMITGYFVLYAAREKQHNMTRILASIKKTGLIYLAVTLLYLPIQLYKIVKEPADPAALLGKVLKAVFFDGTYYHLWYLPAVMLGLLLCYGLLSWGRRAAFICAGLLYIVGLLGDSYYGLAEQIPLLKNGYDAMFRAFSYTRNGLFFAPLFLLLGYEMAVWNRGEKRGGKGSWCRAMLVCLLLMCAEGLLLHSYDYQRHDSMYVMLPFVMVCLFRYLLLCEGEGHERGSFYLNGPMLVYFLHPMIILVLRGFVKVTKLTFLLKVSPVYYLAVAAGSFLAAYVCFMLFSFVRGNGKRRKSGVS